MSTRASSRRASVSRLTVRRVDLEDEEKSELCLKRSATMHLFPSPGACDLFCGALSWACFFQGTEQLLGLVARCLAPHQRERKQQDASGALVCSLHSCVCVLAEGIAWGSAHSRLLFTIGYFLYDMRKRLKAADVTFVFHHAVPIICFTEVLWRASPDCEAIAARVLLVEASTPLLYLWRFLREIRHPLERLAFCGFALMFWTARSVGIPVYARWAFAQQSLCVTTGAEITGLGALFVLNAIWSLLILRVWCAYFGEPGAASPPASDA